MADHVEVPAVVITAVWVALVGSLRHPLGYCWGTAHRDGTWTYEKADTPCFVCEAMEAVKPYREQTLVREAI